MSVEQPRACCAPRRQAEEAEQGALAPSRLGSTRPLPGMVALPGGEFLMGTDSPEANPADGEGPVRRIRLRPFHIAPTAVTNAEFGEFVRRTGYVTEAERLGWSFVFRLFVRPDRDAVVRGTAGGAPWWLAVDGACWQRPEGPGSHIKKREDHPVVHVSWNDAAAYCDWAGVRLPTEAEWEYAARGGLVQKPYPWGDELTPGGRHMCNIWQGRFPEYNTGEDGYLGTAPAGAFPSNGYGLRSAAGNVWEWCADWWGVEHPTEADDPLGPARGTARVIRGGSYLCHRSYCNRYRVAARTSNTPDSATGHMGFRCASDAQ